MLLQIALQKFYSQTVTIFKSLDSAALQKSGKRGLPFALSELQNSKASRKRARAFFKGDKSSWALMKILSV